MQIECFELISFVLGGRWTMTKVASVLGATPATRKNQMM
jgi:hypothetical protein